MSHQRMRFRRGPEQRKAETHLGANRRKNDRRTPGFGWIPLFRDADESGVNEVLGDCEVLMIPAGASLLRYGEANHDVYILLSGELAAHVDTSSNPVTA